MTAKPIIYIPLIKQGVFRHADDSFREMALEWGNRGWVNVVRTGTESPYVWWGGIGKVLLYDRDNWMWDAHRPAEPSELTLVACEWKPEHESSTKHKKWIYWPRHPRKVDALHENHPRLTYQQREIDSVFIGRIENNIQAEHRKSFNEWAKVISVFDMLIAEEGKPYKLSNDEYLEVLRRSRYGLCMRGFGPKCHREMELMAGGTVPLVMAGVDVANYDEPLVEGVHYIRVDKPEDVPAKLAAVSEEQWEVMSEACVAWYRRNASLEGAFIKTSAIIHSFYEAKVTTTPQSVSTLANSRALFDLGLFFRRMEIFHPATPIYVACDTAVKNYFQSRMPKNPVEWVVCLDKYTEYDRPTMEKMGIFMDFVLEKATAMEVALRNHKNTIFLDSDIYLLQPIVLPSDDTDVVLSPHMIKKSNEDAYGTYNVGYFYVANPDFIPWFRETTHTRSKYYEQQTLDYASEKFRVATFPIQDNYGWWRLFECDNPLERIQKFRTVDGVVLYEEKPLRSVHTHFDDTRANFTGEFNRFLLGVLFSEKERQFIDKYIAEFSKKDTEVTSPPTPAEKSRCVNVIIQTYDERNTERANELYICIITNLQHNGIHRVFNMYEGDDESYLPSIVREHPKYVAIRRENRGRLTYAEAFRFANERANTYGDYWCVMNTDIMFAATKKGNAVSFDLDELRTVLDKGNTFIANSRYEYDVKTNTAQLDPVFSKFFHATTQDAWFFKAPIVKNYEKLLEISNFGLGMLGCDNAIAERITRCGYRVYNMPQRFAILHLDSVRGKNSTTFKDFSTEYEKKTKAPNTHPEKEGQLLVPNYDAIRNISIDQLFQMMRMREEDKVWLVSQAISMCIRVKND
jgi:hypothetical protein